MYFAPGGGHRYSKYTQSILAYRRHLRTQRSCALLVLRNVFAKVRTNANNANECLWFVIRYSRYSICTVDLSVLFKVQRLIITLPFSKSLNIEYYLLLITRGFSPIQVITLTLTRILPEHKIDVQHNSTMQDKFRRYGTDNAFLFFFITVFLCDVFALAQTYPRHERNCRTSEGS